MPDAKNPATSEYILGEMAATVRSIDQNVTAIREELGDITKRLGHVETDVASIQAERGAIMPEYQAFIKTVREHMADVNNWRSGVESSVRTVKSGGGLLKTILAALGTLALFIAGQVWSAQRPSVDQVVSGQGK